MKSRDQEAWRQFVEVYGPLVHYWCRRAGLQESEAADVRQEVFRTVSESIGRFRHEPKRNSFRGWLRTVTRTRTIDYLRRQSREPMALGGSEAHAKLLEVSDCRREAVSPLEDDNRLLIRRASEIVLESCKAVNRQAFLRVVVGGERPADVAADLGMSVNAVYLARSQILRRIRQEFTRRVAERRAGGAEEFPAESRDPRAAPDARPVQGSLFHRDGDRGPRRE